MTAAVSADEAAFLSAIAREPGEDTPRLAGADWCDENGQADRAEFIRVQCGQPVPRGDSLWPASIRDAALLVAHAAEWRRGPACDECARGEYESGSICPHCNGTGDAGGLAHWAGVLERNGGWAHRVDFRRGFPFRVHCALAEVLQEHNPSARRVRADWRPTDWAKRVVRAHPVTEFWATDREPQQWLPSILNLPPGCANRWFWCVDGPDSDWMSFRHYVPPPVKKSSVWLKAKWYCNTPTYHTRDEAREALAQALGLIVRAEAYRP